MSKIVVIDPGHGGNDSGALGNGMQEKDIALSVAKKVESLVKAQGIQVVMTRTTDKTLSLAERVAIEKAAKANCFISIHCNSFTNKNSQGLETYSHVKSTDDFAKRIQDRILETGAYTKNRGVKNEAFYVLRNTISRACLVELAFITNEQDANLLRNKQDTFALAIAKGICDQLGVKYVQHEAAQPTQPVKGVYQVICGSYSIKQNALDKQAELKAKGFDSFLEFEQK